MLIRFTLAHVLLALSVIALREPPNATIDVALQVNGAPIAFSARGECTFTDHGTIYDQPASAWTATVEASDGRYVNFASWRTTAAGGAQEMLNLTVMIGGRSHQVSTVKVGDHGQVRGSGSSSFAREGAGGVFTIDARSDAGATIKGRVTCSAFRPPEDNG